MTGYDRLCRQLMEWGEWVREEWGERTGQCEPARASTGGYRLYRGCRGATSKRKDWPEGTVTGWVPKCGAEGGEGKERNQPMRGRSCATAAPTAFTPQAKELFLGPGWAGWT